MRISRSDLVALTTQTRVADIVEIAVCVGARLKRVTATEWVGPCPACSGTDRFSVNTKRRVFNCRGFGGGDVIAMTQHALGLDFAGAVEFITGEARAVPSQREPSPSKLAGVDDEKRRIERACEIWRASVDPRGTIAEAYLKSRRLQLDADIAGAVLRFNQTCPWRDNEADRTIFVPAMIAAMRSIAGDEITAIHRTQLSYGGKKLARRMLGIVAGAGIKLDPDDAVEGGLHIGEGIESCLSARQLGLRPTWALGSSGAIAAFPVLGGVECLTILAEHDSASAKAVEACGGRWHGPGREVLINKAIGGKDLNEVLRRAT